VVLIVEDEFLLRIDAVDMIAAAGLEVVEAANADEAIGILAARRDITVVFHRYPDAGLDGLIELARAVRDAGCRSRLSRPPAAVGIAAADLP